MQEKNKKGIRQKIDEFWGISKTGSSFKVEIFAGLATFLAMAYILTVNPNSILWGGTGDVRWSSVFIATALGAIIGTLLMAFLAKMPLAQASGMGLNSMVGTIVGGAYGFAFSFGNAMLLVLISGIIFLLLSVLPGGKNKETGKLISLREVIFIGMPKAVRNAITVGIGFFIAFIGFQNAGLVQDNQFTLVQFVDLTAQTVDNWDEEKVSPYEANGSYAVGDFVIVGDVVFECKVDTSASPSDEPNSWGVVALASEEDGSFQEGAYLLIEGQLYKAKNETVALPSQDVKGAWELGGAGMHAVVALFGLLVIAILAHYKVKGAVIIGIGVATVLAIPLGVANFDVLLGKTSGVTWNVFENFANFFSMDPSKGGVFLSAFTEGTAFPEGSIMTCVMLIITFAMIDMFDTMGTVVGCATNAGLIDETGKPLNYNKIMLSDSIATCAGAALGTSTVTTFVESGAGVAEGGRTGFTAFITAILFALSIFLLPLFAFIPSAAAASALIYVGVLMMSNVKNIDFEDPANAVPSFLTIIIMLLGYSITKGIGVGVISYVVITIIKYLINLIRYACKKTEKPKWEVSVVALVVSLLFLVYFLVPVTGL